MIVKTDINVVEGFPYYKITSVTPCCNELQNYKDIEFHQDDCHKGVVSIVHHDGKEEAGVYFYKVINYCPFCGERIVIEVGQTKDVTPEYLDLEENRGKYIEKGILPYWADKAIEQLASDDTLATYYVRRELLKN